MGSGFEGKVAIVTGAASGMGRSTAERLGALGARVVLVDIQREAVENVARTLPEGHAVAVAADVSSEAGVQSYVDAAVSAFGRIDLFHNNAGLLGRAAPMAEATNADFDHIFGVNVRGCFLGLRAVIGRMLAQGGGGAIVNTASIAGLRSSPGVGLYSASKFAVIGLTRTAARECGPRGIRVNCICPGPTETAFSAMSDAYRTQLATQAVPLGRIAQAEDMTRAVLWLMSEDAGFINGVVLPVDGGQTA
ncbi:MAG: SDR family NAD(P)-dependent oxidoreductase [Gammaproteobacteria bacterium]